MIYETIPQKYLVVDDMYQILDECGTLIQFIQVCRETLSNLLLEDGISDLTAINIGKFINDYTNFIDNLDHICSDFCDQVMMDQDQTDELFVRYECERNDYINKLKSSVLPIMNHCLYHSTVYKTIINEYNIHIEKMVKIMNGCFNSSYGKKEVITDGFLREIC